MPVLSFIVFLLIVAGSFAGQRFSKTRFWAVAYVIALMTLLFVGAAMRSVSLEQSFMGQLLMRGRLEFVLIGFFTSFLLTMLIFKADGRGVKMLLGVFAFLVVFFYSFMPFFMPELNKEHYRQLKTHIDENGICIQSTNYNCGPAAAVTALAQLGITAEEGEMAILAYSNWVTGTPSDLLCNAINHKLAASNLKCVFKEFSDLRAIPDFPAIAVIEFGFLVDHYVTLLGREGDTLIIGDPDGGRKMMKEQEFMKRWRKIAIVFEAKR